MTPRTMLDRAAWLALAAQPAPALIGLWADTLSVHALLDGPYLVSVAVADGRYPAWSPFRPGAGPFERAVHDLWGHVAEGGDPRPWFHTADWPVLHPMSARPAPRLGRADPPDPPDLPDDRHVLLSGPVRPGLRQPALREPALLRAVTDGLVVTAAEARLGHAHKGTALLMRSKAPRAAVLLVSRLQADSAVAHGIAFARAAEDAAGVAPPPRAEALRVLMAAVEDACFGLAEAGRQALRPARLGPAVDGLRRAAAIAFGHRMMMDCIVPGGVSADLKAAGADALGLVLEGMPPVPDESGPAAQALHALAMAAARRALAQLDALPPGPATVAVPATSGEGLGWAPTPRGTLWHWLRLDGGTIANAFACDPAWHAWSGFAAGLAGQALGPDGIPPDMPGLAVSGADL